MVAMELTFLEAQIWSVESSSSSSILGDSMLSSSASMLDWTSSLPSILWSTIADGDPPILELCPQEQTKMLKSVIKNDLIIIESYSTSDSHHQLQLKTKAIREIQAST
jgi:hypothetical protein